MFILGCKKSYNMFGGSVLYSPVGDLLTVRLDEYGTAIEEIDITACLKSAVRKPRRTLEEFMRSIKEECLLKMIFFGETMLRAAIGQFLEHYHGERNHQGLDNKIIEPGNEVGREDGQIKGRERLGGLLRYYFRDAA